METIFTYFVRPRQTIENLILFAMVVVDHEQFEPDRSDTSESR